MYFDSSFILYSPQHEPNQLKIIPGTTAPASDFDMSLISSSSFLYFLPLLPFCLRFSFWKICFESSDSFFLLLLLFPFFVICVEHFLLTLDDPITEEAGWRRRLRRTCAVLTRTVLQRKFWKWISCLLADPMMASSREQTRSVCEPIFPYLVCTAHSLWRSVASSWPNFKCRWSFYFFSPAKYVADQNDDERGRGGKRIQKDLRGI